MDTAKKILSAFMLLATVSAHADLLLDSKFDGSSKNLDRMSFDERRGLDSFFNRWKVSLNRDVQANNEGLPGSYAEGGRHSAHVVFDNNTYYIWAINYQSAEQDREYDASILAKRKSVTVPGGGVCALYVHDENLKKAASIKINLPENSGGTWCNGIKAIGAAGKGRDGVLVSLSYYLTGKRPAQTASDIGKGWRYMTVLIKFKNSNGKLELAQDDRCFGNPNHIEDILSARRALGKCGG